ncbi:MAG: GntR family transcriptional regulator [Acidobacteria bacterium]|nr:GntR family transcriptional regulator [Acidobacteriota bacterium]
MPLELCIQNSQRLPTVKDLSQKLEINFETIRKAYKELEKEGLISTKRGRGTFADGRLSPRPQMRSPASSELELIDSVKGASKKLLQTGMGLEEVRKIITQALDEVSLECSRQIVVFTECNLLQINQISELLKSYLNLNVEPVLLKDLREKVEGILAEKGELLAVITTGFHMNEVRNEILGLSVKIDFLITNMSPETRREIDALDKTVRYGFICRDQESIPFYKDMLREELGLDSNIDCYILEEETKVQALLESVDVLLVSPPVYDEITRLAPSNLPIFNVFNRVDPMSLKVIKDRILDAM